MTKLTDTELDKLYREYLNEAYDLVNICGLEYQAGDALFEVDPTAYRCGFSDWLDAEIETRRIVEIDGEYFSRGGQ